jgi:hypothetical protein
MRDKMNGVSGDEGMVADGSDGDEFCGCSL